MQVDDIRPLTHSSTSPVTLIHSHTPLTEEVTCTLDSRQGGARGLLQQLHSKLTQPLHRLILGDPPCGHPHLQTDTESNPLRTTHNTTLIGCISCKKTHHCVVSITLGTYPLKADHAHIHLVCKLSGVESVQMRLQLYTGDGERGGSTLSTVGEQRGRERRGVGWGRDGHTQVDTQYRHKWNVTYLSIVQRRKHTQLYTD